MNELFRSILAVEEDALNKEISVPEMLELVSTVNSILQVSFTVIFYYQLLLILLLQPFNGLFSRTTWVSRYQKGTTNLDFTGARDSE